MYSLQVWVIKQLSKTPLLKLYDEVFYTCVTITVLWFKNHEILIELQIEGDVVQIQTMFSLEVVIKAVFELSVWQKNY